MHLRFPNFLLVALILILSAALGPALAQTSSDDVMPPPTSIASSPVFGSNDKGIWAAYWHTDGFSPWRVRVFAATHDGLPEAAAALLHQAVTTKASMVSIDASMAQYRTADINGEALLPVWQPSWARILAAKPVALKWAVPRDGTKATRPVFSLVNGVLSASKVGDVPFGAACDCQTRASRSASTYCLVATQRAALCTRALP